MAQTTGGMSWVDSFIEYSIDCGATWVDMSGFSNTLEVSGGDRGVGEIHTSDGDQPILTAGKRGAIRVTANAIYTEGASDVFQDAHDQYDTDAGGPFTLRWAPAGSDTTSGEQYTAASPGIIESLEYPQGDAGSPDAITFGVTIATSAITKAAV